MNNKKELCSCGCDMMNHELLEKEKENKKLFAPSQEGWGLWNPLITKRILLNQKKKNNGYSEPLDIGIKLFKQVYNEVNAKMASDEKNK